MLSYSSLSLSLSHLLTYLITCAHTDGAHGGIVRPISLLTLSLLRLLDSNFPGNPVDMRIPPLIIKILLEYTLKSIMLVRRLAVWPRTGLYPAGI